MVAGVKKPGMQSGKKAAPKPLVVLGLGTLQPAVLGDRFVGHVAGGTSE
jgi:hypothetical protein